ncbi:MAG: Tripartite tricarboxylate transporter family receptor [Burkholderiales bacterium]|jgi:tripartite-type tricarboxylate transporter receptor subunit TctC|nr:Tripartite tricarboxylate transporter family receptor [Burkholderiales bacterium]
MKRSSAAWLAVSSVIVLWFAQDGTVSAQTYPAKPVRVIAPSSPGGPVDVITRAVMQGMEKTLGQQIVVENRAGAAGLIGTDYVVKQPPDGYTLLFGFSGPLAIVPNLNPNTPYDPVTDLVAITQVATAAYVLLVHPSVPAKNVKQLVALAKARPGKMNFSSGGAGTGIHMAGELFNLAANVRILHVPYKGAAPAVTALMAGEVDMMFNGLPGAIAHIKNGKVRALAVGGATRSPLMPDTPTIAESGLEFKTGGWYGLLAPKGTSRAIVDKVNGALARALNTPEMKARLTQLAVEGDSSTPEAFAKLIADEKALWARVIQKAGIKMK